MSVQVAPHAAHAVEILAAVDVNQRATVRPLDHQRLIFSHLRESVPDDFTVPAEKFVAGGQGGGERVKEGRTELLPFYIMSRLPTDGDRCANRGCQHLGRIAFGDGDLQIATGADEPGERS